MTDAAMHAPRRPVDVSVPARAPQTIGRPRRIAGNVLIGVVALVLIGAASAKLVHAPFLVNQLRPFGFDDTWISILGVIELGSAALFAVPRTRALGLLLITGFLGGAIATHIQHGQVPTQPTVLLAIGWTGVWLRHLEANWSGRSTPRGIEQRSSSQVSPTPSYGGREMKRQDVVLWFSRIILALVAVILVLIASKYLVDPTAASAERGIMLSTGTGRTIARVGFGAFPLACAIVVGACVLAATRVRYGLWFVIVLFGTVLVVRLAGAMADNSLADNVPLIIPEVVFLALTTTALTLGRASEGARQARTHRDPMT